MTIPKPADMAADANGSIYVLSPFNDDFVLPNPISPNYPSFEFTNRMTAIDSRTDMITFQSHSKQSLCKTFGTNVPIAVQGDIVYYFTIELG
jgi:hypothetical protein